MSGEPVAVAACVVTESAGRAERAVAVAAEQLQEKDCI